ncbi:hypothetical protein, partial [Klebsiella pneumoniae]|uniref:hypothetical protein n=1 Tax=Klebsiella pneumoniae TaxID=573 RepID=UPI0025A2F605
TDGEWEAIFDDRQEVRSDTMDPERIAFGLDFWKDPFLTDAEGSAYNFVRRSEKAGDEVRDPKNRKSGVSHRIIWLEERIGVIYEEMVKAGKLKFGDKEFDMSWPFFLKLRPFNVKNATRETCMCIYHMRWDELADGLLKYR